MIADELLQEALDYIRRTNPTPASMALNDKISSYLREFRPEAVRSDTQDRMIAVLKEYLDNTSTIHCRATLALAERSTSAAEDMWAVYCTIDGDLRRRRLKFFEIITPGWLENRI